MQYINKAKIFLKKFDEPVVSLTMKIKEKAQKTSIRNENGVK